MLADVAGQDVRLSAAAPAPSAAAKMSAIAPAGSSRPNTAEPATNTLAPAWVTGITVSRTQLKQATAYAVASGVRHLVQFELMDYTAMTFRDATFTKAFTQETANYATDKRALVREALPGAPRRGQHLRPSTVRSRRRTSAAPPSRPC